MCCSVITRLSQLAFALIAVSLLGANASTAADTEIQCETLFVQNAKDVAMDAKTLTLKGVNPIVVFFCDRPNRHAGHLSSAEFLKSWEQGKDSFTDNPPNAVLSVLDGDTAHDVVVELLSKPRVNGDELTYDIRVIDGDVVSKGGANSLFIDRFGRPFTPLSVAGVARRTTRRAVRRCAYGVTCW